MYICIYEYMYYENMVCVYIMYTIECTAVAKHFGTSSRYPDCKFQPCSCQFQSIMICPCQSSLVMGGHYIII